MRHRYNGGVLVQAQYAPRVPLLSPPGGTRRPFLEIKKSSIAGVSLGLFARRKFKKDETSTAQYTGDYLPASVGAEDENGFEGRKYVLELAGQMVIDAARTNTADERMMNAPTGAPGKRANVRFSENRAKKQASMKATRTIQPGEEFLVQYGRGFWSVGGGKSSKPGRHADRDQPDLPRADGVPPTCSDSEAREEVANRSDRQGHGVRDRGTGIARAPCSDHCPTARRATATIRCRASTVSSTIDGSCSMVGRVDVLEAGPVCSVAFDRRLGE